MKKEKNYTVVDNGYLNDPRLSAREMGLLTKRCCHYQMTGNFPSGAWNTKP